MQNIKELIEENDNLKKEIVQLVEENKSLWFLLDELKASNIKNFHNEFQDVLDSRIEKIKKMVVTKPGEA